MNRPNIETILSAFSVGEVNGDGELIIKLAQYACELERQVKVAKDTLGYFGDPSHYEYDKGSEVWDLPAVLVHGTVIANIALEIMEQAEAKDDNG